MAVNKKEQIHALLKGIESGDPSAVSVVNEEKYIQHNPQTHEGSEGLAVLFKRLSQVSPRVNIVRLFEDGDFVFAHTEYDFSRRNIGFEVFRFEDGQAIEHWDNIQKRAGPNISGHSMVDGAVNIEEVEKTEENRLLIKSFIENVMINTQFDQMTDYICAREYTEHNPELSDDLDLLLARLSKIGDGDGYISYDKCHRLLAEGNFVLSICEGRKDHAHTSFYDLFRIKEGKIAEHWDTVEAIPPASEWKNNNGKF